MKNTVKKILIRKLLLYFAPIILFMLALLGLMFFAVISTGGSGGGQSSQSGSSESFNGEYSENLPIFKEIKGRGQISDEIAQFAVGSAVKYHLLPSVILSQYAYESEWGKSQSAKSDNNFFGITWFNGSPFPQGSSRGVGGSEGGNYMKFPNAKNAFSYYGYMVVSQANFKACMDNKSPKDDLLILGRGGYASAGIDENSAYFKGAMSIIDSNKLTEYDDFAIKHWQPFSKQSAQDLKGDIQALESLLGQKVGSGQCYALTALYVEQKGGPQMNGSGKIFAQNIGEDYDWKQFGWTVIENPQPSDLKAGDVINWQAGGALAPGIYGHTGIIAGVADNGQSFVTYEQQGDGVQIVKKFTRQFTTNPIKSIVRKGQS